MCVCVCVCVCVCGHKTERVQLPLVSLPAYLSSLLDPVRKNRTRFYILSHLFITPVSTHCESTYFISATVHLSAVDMFQPSFCSLAICSREHIYHLVDSSFVIISVESNIRKALWGQAFI